jgi:serine/threonine-protein kinase
MKHIHSENDIVADRYKICSYIAEGGMQQVYKAWDENIERFVALKTPKNDSALKRFQQSAILSARVIHPNVARTLDYFEFEDREYLIEELVIGDDLNNIFISNFNYLDPCLVAHIGHLLSKAAGASHRVGIIHRDLKPSNIMIIGKENFCDIKVTDFGIAKMIDSELALFSDSEGEVESSIAGSSTLVGAIPYMAPEIVLDESAASKASDIWAIGAILYHLLSGKAPFTTQFSKIVISYSKKESPPEISIASSMMHMRGLASQLIDIILSCLDYNVDNRPSSEDLIQKFQSLCYPTKERVIGEVCYRKGGNGWGFIRQNNFEDDVFFHTDEVYGDIPSTGDNVQFSQYPGSPKARAFPIIKIK